MSVTEVTRPGNAGLPPAPGKTSPIEPRRALPVYPPMTDRLLIVDFGSQVTQLIARRVREAGVYCEIHPFQSVDQKTLAEFDPKAIILSGGPASVIEGAAPQADPAIFAGQGAGAGHLLRRADHGAPARRPGRGRPPPRVRPRRGRGEEAVGPVRRRLAARRPQAGLDEPRRPRHEAAAGLRGDRHQRRTRPSPPSPTRRAITTACSSTPR